MQQQICDKVPFIFIVANFYWEIVSFYPGMKTVELSTHYTTADLVLKIGSKTATVE